MSATYKQVDPECMYARTGKVAKSSDGSQWLSAYLSFTDARANSNKFYVVQVLENNSNFHFHTRYGRKGQRGKPETYQWASLDVAEREFNALRRKKMRSGY